MELLRRIRLDLEEVRPTQPLKGIQGHLWEQLILPPKVGRNLLWSPSNTGPLTLRHQVVTVHDTGVFDHPESFSNTFGNWYRWLLPRLLQRVHHVITDSEFSKGRLVDTCRIKPERIAVIPLGVDPRFSQRAESEVAAAKHVLGVPSGRYVLTLGTRQPRKNLRRLVSAWERIVDRIPDDVSLVIAGASPDLLVFNDVVLDRLPARIHFCEHVDDQYLPALYSGALAFAFPSIYEGFGLPPLEAMASNVPVLAGNLSAVPEVVADAALVIDPLNVEMIAAGLYRLIEDDSLREALRLRGLARAKRFTWERAAEMTTDILQRYS